jgi:hypothetical protein
MQLVAIQKHAFVLVQQQRVVLPAVPQLVDHLMKLARPAVAVGMGGLLPWAGAAEVLRRVRIAAGDQVPADPAATDLIQRGELTRQIEGLAVAGAGGRHQTDSGGHRWPTPRAGSAARSSGLARSPGRRSVRRCHAPRRCRPETAYRNRRLRPCAPDRCSDPGECPASAWEPLSRQAAMWCPVARRNRPSLRVSLRWLMVTLLIGDRRSLMRGERAAGNTAVGESSIHSACRSE